ncbi:MAG: TlpA family protein disulfide reductase [Acidobacteria bacterium]|nr:TlpA family protein disulfide reductase [Acidobacteriota bacterium]
MQSALFAVLCALLARPPATAQTTPRPAPKLEITLPDGVKLSLSRFAGKVCVVEFLFTTCPHCQQTSMALSRLNKELGPKGFQPVGVAFNEGAMMLAPEFVRTYNVNYPLGVASRDTVIQFLGVSSVARLMVPQVVFIDRKGVIRAQSSVSGTENLHDEHIMRQQIEQLLSEPAQNGPRPRKGHSGVPQRLAPRGAAFALLSEPAPRKTTVRTE